MAHTTEIVEHADQSSARSLSFRQLRAQSSTGLDNFQSESPLLTGLMCKIFGAHFSSWFYHIGCGQACVQLYVCNWIKLYVCNWIKLHLFELSAHLSSIIAETGWQHPAQMHPAQVEIAHGSSVMSSWTLPMDTTVQNSSITSVSGLGFL